MVRRRIKKATITRIALCGRPKNGLTTLYKSETGEVEFVTLTKMGEDDLLHALVYLPDMADSDGDFASKETIRDFAHTFIREGAKFDINHKGDPLKADQVFLAESTIVQKGDQRFAGFTDAAGNTVDPTDGWGIIVKVLDPDLKDRIKSGDLGGVSLFGPAEVEIVSKANEPQEGHMTPEQMKALMEGLATTLSKSVGDAVSAALAPKVEKVAEKVAFEGDPFNPADIAKHQDMVLFKSLDLTKPADVQKWAQHVASKQAEKPAETKTELEKAQAALAEAQAKIATLQKGSNAGGNDTAPASTPSADIVGLSKSENELAARGLEIAKLLNKQNGRV